MNREIIFRGKRIDNGEWVYGDVHKNESFTQAHIHPVGERLLSFKVIPETVGQFTGLLDKNGTKIFEGDIVFWHSYRYHKCGKYVVVWQLKKCGFGLKRVGEYSTIIGMQHGIQLEVVGNVHEVTP